MLRHGSRIAEKHSRNLFTKLAVSSRVLTAGVERDDVVEKA